MLPAAHILTGAFIGIKTANPVFAFFAGFLSHFVLDNIPHWDYRLEKTPDDGSTYAISKQNLKKWSALTIISSPKLLLDFGVGVLSVFIIRQIAHPIDAMPMIMGVIGSILPDILSGIGIFTNFPLIKKFRKYHHLIHYPFLQKQAKEISPFPWGLASQIIVAIIIILSLLVF